MTATKEKAAPAKAEVAVKEETTTSVTVGGKNVSREEAAAALKEMKQGELDSGYLTFEPGIIKKVVFLGWKPIPGIGENKGKMVNAAKFLTDTGKEQINADIAILSYFEKQPEGCARQITCKGTKTTPNGTYKDFDFHELVMPKK